MAEVKFIIDGKEVNPPMEWRETKVLAAWINSSVQPKIITDQFTFVNEAAQIIKDYIAAGETTGVGIARGLPLQIQAADVVDGTVITFDGYIDFLSGYEYTQDRGVRVSITRPEDLDLLNKRLEAISFAYLADKGVITKKDFITIPYVIQKADRAEALLYIAFTEFFLVKEALETYERLETIFAGLLVPTTAPTSVLVAIITIIYFLAIIVMILKLLAQVIGYIIPQRRAHYGMTYRKLLEKAFSHIGLSLDTNIPELDQVAYLPSRTAAFSVFDLFTDGYGVKKVSKYVKTQITRSGIPQPSDFGYRCSEMVQLVLDMFNAKIKVDTNSVYIYTESDPLWVRNSKYVLPDVFLDRYRLNVSEAVATKIFSFSTDQSDEWSIEDFTGTNYEVNTESSQSIELKYRLLKGFKDFRFPVALASRYGIGDDFIDGINTFVANAYTLRSKAYDKIFKKAKISNPFAKMLPPQIKYDFGVVRVSNHFWSLPKAVVMKNGLVPKNHRDILSARILYHKYHSYNSFASPYTGQRRLYDNVKIPFGLKDYLDCQYSSYFKTADGKIGRFLRLEWCMGYDYAEVDFEVFEPYIKTIKETTFEP